jgi:hypothetical protein
VVKTTKAAKTKPPMTDGPRQKAVYMGVDEGSPEGDKTVVVQAVITEGKVEVVSVETKEPVTALATKLEVSPELVERLDEAQETLALLEGENITLPVIRLGSDGFEMSEGAEPIMDFKGTIIYTKLSNVFFKKKYKAGQVEQPDCASSDGKTPDKSIISPVSKNCLTCSHNEFGSAHDGEGKLCKNTRPVFVLVDNEDVGMGIMPKVLRVSPTSLGLIKNYLTDIACDFGLAYSVKTKFSCFKKDESQVHYNVKFRVAGRQTKQDKVNIRSILAMWKPVMTEGMFGLDVVDVTPEQPPQPATNEQHGAVAF